MVTDILPKEPEHLTAITYVDTEMILKVRDVFNPFQTDLY